MGMVSEVELNEYADKAIAGLQLESIRELVDRQLVDHVELSIRSALERLNELPPEDPFWERTNRRPTVHKAMEWSRARIASNPEDSEARWIVASLMLARGQYGSEEVLAPLLRADLSNVRWLVGASEWLSLACGPDQDAALRSALETIAELPELKSRLEQLVGMAANEAERRAARVALAVLAGASMTDAVAGTK